ncbi:MAG TPA: hypothetical protein VF331_25600 [Polyangiales bacterium]
MARLQPQQTMDFAEADAMLDRALAVNPQLTAAHVTRAGMALRNLDLTAADAALDRALAVDSSDLEALSVRAAVRFLADDPTRLARAERAALSRNPRCGSAISSPDRGRWLTLARSLSSGVTSKRRPRSLPPWLPIPRSPTRP